MSIRRKTLLATYWSGSKNVIVQVTNISKVIILARFMTPEEFGVYAVALLALALIEAFSTTGVEDALIQHPDDIDKLIGTAWGIQIIRGIVLAGLIWYLSGPIALLMGSRDAAPVIALLAGMPLIRSFQNMELVRYVRDVRFHWDFLLSTVDVVVSFVVALLLVSRIGGTMALAMGLVLLPVEN